MKTIKVNNFEIGADKTFVIADIGSNHKQDLELAKESIAAAAESGANAIKFQSIQLNELYFRPDKTISEFIKKLEFPEEWHFILKEYCDKRNILFFSSPTYLKSVDLLEEINVPIYKLASAQIGTFPQLIHKVAALNKPTIFSTGIATYEEVIRAVNIFKKYNNDKFIILHCNSIYPTPPQKVNMQLMNIYKQMFGNPVGYSDHTNGTHIACAAVTMGAKVIEKHFTLSRELDTPDSNSFASDPDELKLLVNQIKDIEAATNVFSDRMNIQSEELKFKDSITYNVFSNKDIEVNESLKEEKLKYLRASDGINAVNVLSIIGKKALRNIKAGEKLTQNDFE